MSPHSFDQDGPERVINGPRPSPLQINKHSNVIQKSAQYHRKFPVIVYVRSPKIIHTRPSEFMALVQKLTGFMHQTDDAHNERDGNESSIDQNLKLNKNISISAISYEKKEMCSNVAEEKYDENSDVREASSSVPPTPRSHNRTLLQDFPLYTPNYSADHVLRFSDIVHISISEHVMF
ncbi:uncharacterized protein LOC141680778 [Apium graveolens]|uniref:uncharacterized protein LOC141680778 n=1 Tax=Apium graveolens TaxID=4045 RepID=UPI003D7BB10A